MINVIFTDTATLEQTTESFSDVNQVADRMAALYTQDPRIFKGGGPTYLYGVTGSDPAVPKLAYFTTQLYRDVTNLAALKKSVTDLIARPIGMFEYLYEIGQVDYDSLGPDTQAYLDGLVATGTIRRPR